MNDMFCSVSETKDHIVVLASVKLGPEELCAVKKSSLENAEMADVIVGSEIVYCVIGLEMHGDHLVDVIALKGSLVAVDVICLFFINGLHIPVKGLRMKNVIMVKKTYIFTLCQFKAVVGIAGNTLVLFKLQV